MEIPVYESKKDFKSGESLFEGSKQDLSVARETGAIAKETTKGIDTFAKKIQEARDFAEYNDAMTGSKEALTTISANADRDPNMDNMETYVGQMSEVKNEVMSSLSPHLQTKYGANFDAAAALTGVSIKKSYWKKAVDAGKTALYNGMNSLALEYQSTNDPKQIENIMLRKKDLLGGAVNAGYMTKLESAKMDTTSMEEWAYKKGMMLLRDDAAAGLDILKDGNQLQELTPEARSKLIDLGLKMKTKQDKDNEKLVEMAQTEAEVALGMQLVKDEATLVDIIDLMNDGAITPEYANDAFKFAMRNHQYMETDKAAFNLILDKALDPEVDLQQFNAKMISAENVSDKDRAVFTGFVSEGYDYAIKQKAKLKEQKWINFKNMLGTMKNWVMQHSAPADRESDLYDMSKPLFDTLMQGNLPASDVMRAGKELIKQKITEKFPATGVLNDVPNAVASKGNYEAVSEESEAKANRTYKRPEEKPQYSEADIAYTAEQEGITVKEVKRQLGITDGD